MVKLAVVALLSSLIGCSYLSFPGVYRIDIPQGNTVTQEMVDQLELGMSPQQVRFVMGTPLLADPFNLNRWDYYYSLKKDGKLVKQQLLSVFFENNRLAQITGELAPEPVVEEEPLDSDEEEQQKIEEIQETLKIEK